MSKKAKYRKIHNTRYYTPHELAECVGVTPKTIYSHIELGLPADKGVKPYLICGAEAKDFYCQFYNKTTIDHGKDEVLCHGCGRVFSFNNIEVKCTSTGKYYNDAKVQVMVEGRCPYCQRKFNRFKSMKAVKGMKTGATIPIAKLIGKE
ncbi:MAG: hypothetical protein P9L97_04075 [Candidatus Tenebribacter davisii]|nr:hypothetical protein [Candidatus Tenebribacter davisii]